MNGNQLPIFGLEEVRQRLAAADGVFVINRRFLHRLSLPGTAKSQSAACKMCGGNPNPTTDILTSGRVVMRDDLFGRHIGRLPEVSLREYRE